MRDKIFIGAGFLDSQLLWLLPLVKGYASKKNIKKIILHKKLSNRLKKHKIFNKILNDFHVQYIDDLSIFKRNRIIRYIFILLVLLPKAFLLSFKISKKKLLDKNINWKEYQIYHSVWDTAVKESSDGVIIPNYYRIVRACLIAVHNQFEAKLSLKNNANHFFLGHTVYGYRAFLAEIRNSKNKIFCHSGFTIYKQFNKKDNSWCFLEQKVFKKLTKNVSDEDVNNYWKLRQAGKGNYEDSRIAAKIKNKNPSSIQNVIFLHIFRDSPFADIDRTRIFEDYISWINFTLEIIKQSNENWLLRLHPSYKRWGEDQNVTLNKIFLKKFGKKLPKNIKLEDNINSNYEIFKKAKRVITFNGTSHLEAACFGIKPVIISNAMLNIFDQNLVIKPKTLESYKKILLENSTSLKFKISKKKSFLAKKIMFVREKALKFEKEVGGFHVFRGDPVSRLNLDYKQTNSKLEKNINFLSKNGVFLSKNNNITLSKKFLK